MKVNTNCWNLRWNKKFRFRPEQAAFFAVSARVASDMRRVGKTVQVREMRLMWKRHGREVRRFNQLYITSFSQYEMFGLYEGQKPRQTAPRELWECSWCGVVGDHSGGICEACVDAILHLRSMDRFNLYRLPVVPARQAHWMLRAIYTRPAAYTTWTKKLRASRMRPLMNAIWNFYWSAGPRYRTRARYGKGKMYCIRNQRNLNRLRKVRELVRGAA